MVSADAIDKTGTARKKIPARPERNHGQRSFQFKCSNLARGESMKDPVGAFGCRPGFSFRGGVRAGAMRISLAARRCVLEQIAAFRIVLPDRGAPMPPWLEVLLNVIGFAGFIAIAKYHKSRSEKLPDR